MQTLHEIRGLLQAARLHPQRRFGQCFLIDKNLMSKVLDLAGLTGAETVLEVGPGTGSLTEELLGRSAKVVAVEIDRGLVELLRRTLAGRDKLVLIHGDVLAGKNELSPAVLEALDGPVDLVSNLPYNIATPLVGQCLKLSWRSACRGMDRPVCFRRLTFTVQREVAGRMTAPPGSGDYGPISVLAALLARLTVGPVVPASAFWPAPKVQSRILRIDFDASAAAQVADQELLSEVVATAFQQRRKQIGSVARRTGRRWTEGLFRAGLEQAEIDPATRPEQLGPWQYRALANALVIGSKMG